MFKVIFAVCVVTFVVQIGGRYVVRDTPKFKYNNQENLDMKKMLGEWYPVIRDDRFGHAPKVKCYSTENFNTKNNKLGQWHAGCDDDETYASKCLSVELHRNQSNKFSVLVCKYGCTDIDLTISHRNSGEPFFTTDDERNPWFQINFVIPETDYDNYAVIEMEHNFFMPLSRNKFPDPGQFDKLATKYNIPFSIHTTK